MKGNNNVREMTVELRPMVSGIIEAKSEGKWFLGKGEQPMQMSCGWKEPEFLLEEMKKASVTGIGV